MFFKKVLKVVIHHGFDNYFRIAKQVYKRYKRDGWEGIRYRLDKKYNVVDPTYFYSTQEHRKDLYKIWISQNETNILKTYPLNYFPLISILTPTYNTEEKYLIEMLESVLAQTYTNWELCIADDASTNETTLTILKEYESKYKNIKIVYRKQNGHISQASNSALSLASGEYIALLDHDDTLSPNALYEMAKKLNEDKNLKFIYSDEDKIDDKSQRFNPHFKSGWNPDMLFSQNYICHFTLLQKDIVEKIGGFREGYEGSQDYDLFLRYTKVVNENEIARVEKILYHWRAIEGSTALGSHEKNYTHEAGLKALKGYFKDQKGVQVHDGLMPNTYKVSYSIPFPAPLISLLIPTRDGYELIKKCIDSILTLTDYQNYEIIILDNQTTCTKTLDYFNSLKKNDKIRVLQYSHPFNYSAINNFGVEHAKGEIIGLINNDIEVINKEWLSEMVSQAIRKEIGAVGAKLYYPNNTIQHGGVILGIGGVAGHAHKYLHKRDPGYFSRLTIVHNLSAITGACLIVEKKLYQEAGGLNEENLAIAFNDVDFCLKLLHRGYHNLWTPYAELYHHESVSRGAEDNSEKIKRFNTEIAYMKERWLTSLQEDNSYNTNLTKVHENFGLNTI